jgi:hypothetical protein
MERIVLDISTSGLTAQYLEQASRYVLIGTSRMAYLITDQSQRVLAVKSWELQTNSMPAVLYLRKILESDQLMSQPYAETTVGIQNNLHAITPNRMFDPSRLPAYFRLLTAFGKSHHYAFDDLPNADSKLVYAIAPELKDLLDEKIPNARIVHAMSAMVETCRTSCNASTYNVFVHVYNHNMQVILFDGLDLLFFNTYTFSSASDFVYYALLPLTQLQINASQVSPVVSGEITEDADCITVLRRFTGPIRFMPSPQIFEYPGAIQSLPGHFCFDLYALKLKK